MAVATEVMAAGATYGGTWTDDANAAHSGGTAKKSTVAASTASYTFTGRALYLFHAVTLTGGVYTVSIDGGAAVTYNQNIDSAFSNTTPNYRVLTMLATGLADTSHTILLTVISGTVWVNSLIVVHGARLTPTVGALVTIGDSFTAGTGASQATLYYAARLQQTLQMYLGRPIVLNNQGVGSDRLAAFDGTHTGGVYRFFSACLAGASTGPEFLTFLYGYNDVFGAGFSPGDVARLYTHLLWLILDTLVLQPPNSGASTAACKAAVSTPPYIGPALYGFATAEQAPNVAASAASGHLVDTYDMAVWQVRIMQQQFPAIRAADVYAAYDYRSSLCVPNASGDYGLHPNNTGHNVIQAEFARVLLS